MKKLIALLFGFLILITAGATPHLARAVETSFFNIIPCDAVDQAYIKATSDAQKKAQEEYNKPGNATYFIISVKDPTGTKNYTHILTPDLVSVNSGSTYFGDQSEVAGNKSKMISGGVTYIGPNIVKEGAVVLSSGQQISATAPGNRIDHIKRTTIEKYTEKFLAESGVEDKGGCGFDDFIKMIQNIIRAIIILSIPVTMIVLTWVGVVLLTSVGNVSKIQYAKGVAWKVIFGFITILLAWLLVEAIYIAITGKGFNEFFK